MPCISNVFLYLLIFFLEDDKPRTRLNNNSKKKDHKAPQLRCYFTLHTKREEMSVITRIIKCQEHRNKTLVLKLSCYLQLVQMSITCRLTLIIAHEQRSQIIVSTCVCVCVTGKSLLSMSCYYRNVKRGGNHIAPIAYRVMVIYANNDHFKDTLQIFLRLSVLNKVRHTKTR